MSKWSLFNIHWSRQQSCMRYWWNKLFFIIIRVIVVVNQCIILSPFLYFKKSERKISSITTTASKCSCTWKFRTHRLVTILAILLWILNTTAAPFTVKAVSELYSITRRNQNDLFVIIAKFTKATDILCVLLLLLTHIWQRESIVKILNSFNEILSRFEQLEKNLIDFKILLVLVLKIAFTFYDVVTSLPYIFSASSRLSAQGIVAFVHTQYLQVMSSFIDLSIFLFILLLLTCSMQLEKELKYNHVISNDLNVSKLINLENSLQQLINMFRNTFQFAMFLLILLYFVTILCNIYALLDYYVTTHHLYNTFIIYLFSMTLQLYSLILITYMCDASQRRVKDLFLQREEIYFLKPRKSSSLVETDILWPQLNQFELLGLYTVNNEFALFLFTFSINFITIILEFEINKAHK